MRARSRPKRPSPGDKRTAGKTRFFRSVPSERDVASRAAAEPGWRERTRRPNIEHADDRLASLRSCGFGRVTATAAATGIPAKRRSFYSLDADSAPRASPPPSTGPNFSFQDDDKPAKESNTADSVQSNYIHIRSQQRNGRKSLTTIQVGPPLNAPLIDSKQQQILVIEPAFSRPLHRFRHLAGNQPQDQQEGDPQGVQEEVQLQRHDR